MKRKFLFFIAILLLVIGIIGCSRKVKAGHVGIIVNLYGSKKGIDYEVKGPGKYVVGLNEELHIFPTFKQNYVWTKDPAEGSLKDESITFQTREGMTISADIGITYKLDNTKIGYIFEEYRRGVDEITDTFLRNEVRDSFNIISSTYTVESIIGVGKASLFSKVNKSLRQSLGGQGILIEKIYLVGEFRLPEKVRGALNDKIQATQRAEKKEYELREEKAEADKIIVKAKGEAEAKIIVARGESEANKIRQSSISPILIEYEKVLIQKEAIEAWNGKLPMYTGGPVPFLEIGGDIEK